MDWKVSQRLRITAPAVPDCRLFGCRAQTGKAAQSTALSAHSRCSFLNTVFYARSPAASFFLHDDALRDDTLHRFDALYHAADGLVALGMGRVKQAHQLVSPAGYGLAVNAHELAQCGLGQTHARAADVAQFNTRKDAHFGCQRLAHGLREAVAVVKKHRFAKRCLLDFVAIGQPHIAQPAVGVVVHAQSWAL